MNESSNNNFPKKHRHYVRPGDLPFGLEITQFIYLISSLISSVSFLFKIFGTPKIDFELFWSAISVLIYWTFFYGTYKIKEWVIIPILNYSIISIFKPLLIVFYFRPENQTGLLQKGLITLIVLFFLLQIYVFTRTETKRYFKAKGTTLVL